jgi:hypothetical protein
MTQDWQSSLEYISVQSCEAAKTYMTLLSAGKYAHTKMASWTKDYGGSIYEGPVYNQLEALVLVALNEGIGEFSDLKSCAGNSKKLLFARKMKIVRLIVSTTMNLLSLLKTLVTLTGAGGTFQAI